MQKLIFFSHGEKGGVGKTAVASAAIEMLLGAGCKIGIVEGDTDNGDVALRYEGTVRHIKRVRLSDPSEYQKAVNDLAGWVSEITGSGEADVIVVNMPANAATTVDRDIETLAAALEEIDVQVVTAISSGNTDQSIHRTVEIATKGLGSLGAAVVLAPEFLKDDSISARLDARGLKVSVYPRLSPDTMQVILDHPRQPLSDLVTPTGPVKSPIQRIRIGQYLRQAREVLKPLFAGLITDDGTKAKKELTNE